MVTKRRRRDLERIIPQSEANSHQSVPCENYKVVPGGALAPDLTPHRFDVALTHHGIAVWSWAQELGSSFSMNGRASLMSPHLARRMAYALLNAANEFESPDYHRQLADLGRLDKLREF